MDNTFNQIQELLHKRAELYVRLKLIPYDGTPEIKPKGNEKMLKNLTKYRRLRIIKYAYFSLWVIKWHLNLVKMW